jgi:hypothetical protein
MTSTINDSASGIIYRAAKGTPLTNDEVDANFKNLDDTKLSYNAPVVQGPLTMQQCIELFTEMTAATGVVVHDFSQRAIWYHSTIGNNFTVNLINVPTTTEQAMGVTLVLAQGVTGYIPNVIQINGSAQTIKWANGIVPTPSSGAGKLDIVTFSILRISTPAWVVAGQLLPFA